MKRTFSKTVALALACAAGCTGVTSCNSMTDETLTLAQGTYLYSNNYKITGIGSVVGVGISMIISLFEDDTWATTKVDGTRGFSSQEARIKANIKQMKTRISDVKKTNYTLEREMDDLRKTKKADRGRLWTIRSNVERRREVLDKNIATAQDALSRGSTDRDGELRTLIGQLEGQRDTMMDNMSKLSSLARENMENTP